MRRQQQLFTAVRLLHQSNYLLQAQQSRSPQPPASKTPPPLSSSSNNLSTQKTQDPAPSSSPTDVTTSTQPKTLTEKAKELWSTAKYLFKFYFNGVKQIWANRTQVKLVQSRVSSGGSPLTREESQLIRTHNADMRKLPLFLFILLILEEALPLVVIWAPSLLPSTCILPNQLVKIRMGEEVKRAEAWKALKASEEVTGLTPVVQDTKRGLVLAEPHRGQDSDILKRVSAEDLTRLAKIFSLSTWGGSSMIRRRLDSHLAYLRSDDALMCTDPFPSSLPQHVDALAKACGERGLRCTGIPHLDMLESLRTWLRYTTRNPDTKSLSDASLALLPLQLYNPNQLNEVQSEIEAESARGIIDKTKDVLREVVEEEKKVISRDEKSKEEVKRKQQQQQQ